MEATDNKQTIRRAAEYWNAHDERYFDPYAVGAAIHGLPPELRPTVQGMKQMFAMLWDALPDARAELLHLAADGDLVAGHFEVSGTHVSEFMGAAPTGNRIEFEGMSFFRFDDDGRIVERWLRLDDLGLLAQLGLLPEPVSA